jgi:hypothetical protein
MGTDGKYIVTYRIFIVTALSDKIKKRPVRHESSPSRKNVLVQELVRDQKLAADGKIAVIKLFYVEASASAEAPSQREATLPFCSRCSSPNRWARVADCEVK